jgi:hypothetical protein
MCLAADTATPEKASREMLLEGLLRSSEKHDAPPRISLLATQDMDPTDHRLSSVTEGGRGLEEADEDALADSGRRRSLSNPVSISVHESPLAGGGQEEDLDLDDRVEDAGDYSDDICLRGGGEEEAGPSEGTEEDRGEGEGTGGGISHEVGQTPCYHCFIMSNIKCICFYISFAQAAKNYTVVSADDFLPMFTFVLVQADLPQMMLVKELMSTLVDNEELYGECGEYSTPLHSTSYLMTLTLTIVITLSNKLYCPLCMLDIFLTVLFCSCY